MAHDVFISYSSKDKPVADAVCAALEAERIRCWIAPRDVLPSVPYGEAIIEALNQTRLLVLIFTANSNTSRHVMREVERAVNKGIPIVPFRVEDVRPSPSMEYFISSDHWLDALTPPLEGHIRRLAETVNVLRGREARAAHATRNEPQPATTHDERPPATTHDEPQPAATTRDERRSDALPLPPPSSFSTTPLTPSAHATHAPQVTAARPANWRPLLFVGLAALAAVALLIAALAFFKFGGEDASPAAEISGAVVAPVGESAQPAETPLAEESRVEQTGGPSKPRLVLEGHTDAVKACAFSPDGKLVASGGEDKSIKLWDAETGELRQTIPNLESDVLALAFSPDGRLLAAGFQYGSDQRSYSLHVFEVRDGRAGRIAKTLTHSSNAFSAVAFSADGKTLLGGSRPAMLWATEDWSLKHDSIQTGVNPAFALSPDGRLVAAGGTNESQINIWDAETGESKLALEGHEKGMLALAFSPDGRTLVSGSYDDTARLWDAETGESRLTLEEDDLNAVFSVAFSPDGATVATGTYHWIKLWDARTGALRQKLDADQMGITYRLTFSPDGRILAGASDNSIKLWDVSE